MMTSAISLQYALGERVPVIVGAEASSFSRTEYLRAFRLFAAEADFPLLGVRLLRNTNTPFFRSNGATTAELFI
jgi:hypothetical protein